MELNLLDRAWADSIKTRIVVLIAAGAVGKTSLIKRWVERVKDDARRVYAGSFSQGTSEADFLADACSRLAWQSMRKSPRRKKAVR
jgi:hypothetical protein